MKSNTIPFANSTVLNVTAVGVLAAGTACVVLSEKLAYQLAIAAPEEPSIPDVPAEPEVPVVPAVPLVQLEPLVPVVPDVPELPAVPPVPVVPDVHGIQDAHLQLLTVT